MADTIPLFPLEEVLLPGLPLPLHIFEPRYRQMLHDIRTAGSAPTFGIVALTRGTDTSTDVEVAKIGTLAEIRKTRPYPDGSSDLLVVGGRRFQVVALDSSGTPYLRGHVEWLTDEVGELTDQLLPDITAAFARYRRLIADLTGRGQEVTLPADPTRLSYEMPAHMLLSLAQRQHLLAMSTAAERLEACLALMRREITLIEQTRTVPVGLPAIRLVQSQN